MDIQMVEARIKEFIDDLKNDPKADILYVYKGMRAMNKVKKIEFTDLDEADDWADQWTTAQKKKACLIIYSRLKRVHSEIRYKFFIADSVLGKRFTYEKGMKMIQSML